MRVEAEGSVRLELEGFWFLISSVHSVAVLKTTMRLILAFPWRGVKRAVQVCDALDNAHGSPAE